MNWYSNDRLSLILTRGAIAVAVGFLVAWLVGARSEIWLIGLGVPALLTMASIARYIAHRRGEKE